MFSPCSSRPPLTPLPSVLDVTVDVVVEGAVERDVGACLLVSISWLCSKIIEYFVVVSSCYGRRIDMPDLSPQTSSSNPSPSMPTEPRFRMMTTVTTATSTSTITTSARIPEQHSLGIVCLGQVGEVF